MLSTAQAQRLREGVIGLLAQIKAHAAAHPARPVPQNLLDQLSDSLDAVLDGFASPESTWKKLLQHKVNAATGLHAPTDRQAEWVAAACGCE